VQDSRAGVQAEADITDYALLEPTAEVGAASVSA
jgi:hypothetical protein